MKPSLFVSYSRRQIPFIDHLVGQLERRGYPVWLDYHSLVPAQPWDIQIEEGIAEADVFVLVISREALNSKYVEAEWRRALELGKRILLIIFEAVSLPPELKNCEWVDFRINHDANVYELTTRLEKRRPIYGPPPQTGFQAPCLFWLALFLSILAVIGSVPHWWMILVPYILLPLPLQIYKRTYKVYRVMPILLYLPFLYIPTVILTFISGQIFNHFLWFTIITSIPTILICWALFGLLITRTMQIRGYPEAAGIDFSNPLIPDTVVLRSMIFAIDHAPEDGKVAYELQYGLEKFGHRLAKPDENPETVFVLISSHKNGSIYDPEHQVVYPVILQPVQEISPSLQRIQWIDFRRGIQNVDKLARLLPEPQKLLKALAVPPVASQESYPLEVTALLYFFLTTGMMGISSLFSFAISFFNLLFRGEFRWDEVGVILLGIVNGGILFWSVSFTLQALRSRNRGSSSLYPLIVMTVFQICIHLMIMWDLITAPIFAFKDQSVMLYLASGLVPMLNFGLIIIGVVIGVPVLIIRWRNFNRWLPRFQQYPVGRLEKIFLLYAPARGRILIYHITYHIMILVVYIGLNFIVSSAILSYGLTYSVETPFPYLWMSMLPIVSVGLVVVVMPATLIGLFAYRRATRA